MPIYEYQCESCGEVVEQWQRMSDPPLDVCDACGGVMHKLISQSSFHLKGSGWYVTDYASNKGGASTKKDDSGSKCETKSNDSGSSSGGKSSE